MTDDKPPTTKHVPDDSAALYKVAYDESVRGLTQQAGVLDGLRTRAGMLITAANVVTAFLAPQALTNGSGLHWGAGGAILAFLGCLGCALFILWSRGSWTFALDANRVIAEIEGDAKPMLGDLYSVIAVMGEKAWQNNAKTLGGMFLAFKVGCALMGIEVIAWIAVLAKVNVTGVVQL